MTWPGRRGRLLRRVGIVLGAVAGLLVLLTLCGYLLPGEIQLADSRLTLEGSSAEFFPLFDSRAGQQRMWTQAWRRSGGEKFPPMKIADLGGPDAGVGTGLGFFPDGTKLGSVAGVLSVIARGRGLIVESVPARKVVIDIDFGFVEVRRTVALEVVSEEATEVRWIETLRFPHPLARYLSLAIGSADGEGFNGVLAAAEDVVRADRKAGE